VSAESDVESDVEYSLKRKGEPLKTSDCAGF